VYRKYLGEYASRYVKTNLKEYVPPTFYQSSDYVRTGTIISLVPDETYYKKYPQVREKIFINHLLPAYFDLVGKLP
jgi:hypothetical protein